MSSSNIFEGLSLRLIFWDNDGIDKKKRLVPLLNIIVASLFIAATLELLDHFQSVGIQLSGLMYGYQPPFSSITERRYLGDH